MKTDRETMESYLKRRLDYSSPLGGEAVPVCLPVCFQCVRLCTPRVCVRVCVRVRACVRARQRGWWDISVPLRLPDGQAEEVDSSVDNQTNTRLHITSHRCRREGENGRCMAVPSRVCNTGQPWQGQDLVEGLL